MPPEIGTVTWGGSEASVRKQLGIETSIKWSAVPDETGYWFEFTKDRLTDIVLKTKTDIDPLPIMTKQWGPPITLPGGVMQDRVEMWFSPANNLRASVAPYNGSTGYVTFSHYESLTSLLGAKGAPIAMFEGKPFLGATLDELHAAWGTRLCRWDDDEKKLRALFATARVANDFGPATLVMCAPAPRGTSVVANPDTVRFGADKRVQSITLSIYAHDSAPLVASMMKELEAKFGPGVVEGNGDEQRTVFVDPATKLRAIVQPSQGGLAIELSQ